jgi:hypothetical protein
MRGRMIHDEKGRQHSQPYDRDGQVNSMLSFAVSTELTLAGPQ